MSVSGSKAPENVKRPVVLGSESPGRESLTCSPGEWRGSPTPTFKYQWLREGVAIGSATASIYTVVVEDETHHLSCKVTAENGQGSPVTVESENKIKVPGEAPKNIVPPQISGIVEAEHTVICEKGTWTGTAPIAYTYQWVKEKDVAIAGETKSTFLITKEDRGLKIACQVTAKNTEGSETVSTPEVTVPANGGRRQTSQQNTSRSDRDACGWSNRDVQPGKRGRGDLNSHTSGA